MSRRRLFGSLCSMVFLVNLGRVVFAPLIEPLATDFAVSPAELGVVATLAWLGSALSRVSNVPLLLVVIGGLVGLHVTGRIPAGRVPGTPAGEG